MTALTCREAGLPAGLIGYLHYSCRTVQLDFLVEGQEAKVYLGTIFKFNTDDSLDRLLSVYLSAIYLPAARRP
jgi:hypothetical protein